MSWHVDASLHVLPALHRPSLWHAQPSSPSGQRHTFSRQCSAADARRQRWLARATRTLIASAAVGARTVELCHTADARDQWRGRLREAGRQWRRHRRWKRHGEATIGFQERVGRWWLGNGGAGGGARQVSNSIKVCHSRHRRGRRWRGIGRTGTYRVGAIKKVALFFFS